MMLVGSGASFTFKYLSLKMNSFFSNFESSGLEKVLRRVFNRKLQFSYVLCLFLYFNKTSCFCSSVKKDINAE